MQDPDGQEIWIPLPTKGYVGLRIFIDASRAHESMMSWGELANDVIIGPTQFVAQLPLVFRHSYSTATIRLTVEKANKLPAADGLDIPKIAAIQQNTGWSDPYAVIKIAGQKFNTKTINRTINPVWNESFDITALVREFTARELEIEVSAPPPLVTWRDLPSHHPLVHPRGSLPTSRVATCHDTSHHPLVPRVRSSTRTSSAPMTPSASPISPSRRSRLSSSTTTM